MDKSLRETTYIVRKYRSHCKAFGWNNVSGELRTKFNSTIARARARGETGFQRRC